MQVASNLEIAEALERIAELLEVQDAGLHRVRAYRRAAASFRALPRAAAEVDAEGLEALQGFDEAEYRTRS